MVLHTSSLLHVLWNCMLLTFYALIYSFCPFIERSAMLFGYPCHSFPLYSLGSLTFSCKSSLVRGWWRQAVINKKRRCVVHLPMLGVWPTISVRSFLCALQIEYNHATSRTESRARHVMGMIRGCIL